MGSANNRVIRLPPLVPELRIDFDQYFFKGPNGTLYLILPDNYTGPKETFILHAFPGYNTAYRETKQGEPKKIAAHCQIITACY